ncbi:MAG: hypothetical protein ACTSUE_07585 [Promethearchaeota archaeon]
MIKEPFVEDASVEYESRLSIRAAKTSVEPSIVFCSLPRSTKAVEDSKIAQRELLLEDLNYVKKGGLKGLKKMLEMNDDDDENNMEEEEEEVELDESKLEETHEPSGSLTPNKKLSVLKKLIKESRDHREEAISLWDRAQRSGVTHPLGLMINNQIKESKEKELRDIHKEAKRLRIDSLTSKDPTRASWNREKNLVHLPKISYNYEASYMRPARPGEKKCVSKKQCMGFKIAQWKNEEDVWDGFSLVQFQHEDPHVQARMQGLCVLCLRYKVTMDWNKSVTKQEPLTTVIQPYRNIVGEEGEYDISMAIPIFGNEFHGICDPFIRFQVHQYKYVFNKLLDMVQIQQCDARFRLTPTALTRQYPAVERYFNYQWEGRLGECFTALLDEEKMNGLTPNWKDLLLHSTPSMIGERYKLVQHYAGGINFECSLESSLEWIESVSSVILLEELLGNTIKIQNRIIVENYLEREIARMHVLSLSRPTQPNHKSIVELRRRFPTSVLVSSLDFGLYKVVDAINTLYFAGIVGKSHLRETAHMPLTEFFMMGYLQNNSLSKFPEICANLCGTHEYMRKWVATLFRCSFGGFYPHSVFKPPLIKRLELMAFHANYNSCVMNIVTKHPYIVILILNEYIVFASRTDRILRRMLENHHLAWDAFEDLIVSSMNDARQKWYQNQSLESLNAFLEQCSKSKSKKQLFKRDTGNFWNYITANFNFLNPVRDARQNIRTVGKGVKMFDSRFAYNGVYHVLLAAHNVGYSRESILLVQKLYDAFCDNESDKKIREKITKSNSMDLILEAFNICLVVTNSFRIRIIDMPWHWYLQHKNVDSNLISSSPHNSEIRLDRRSTYICPNPKCYKFKAYIIQSEMEFANTKRKATKKQPRTNAKTGTVSKPKLDDNVHSFGTRDVFYDPQKDRVYCFMSIKQGRAKRLGVVKHMIENIQANKSQEELTNLYYAKTEKKKSKNSEPTIIDYKHCVTTELVPVKVRGSIVISPNGIHSKCVKCGGICAFGIMRGIRNVFTCSQCDRTVQKNKCETCSAVHNPNNKATWTTTIAHNKPGVHGSVKVWICPKCLPDIVTRWVKQQQFWDFNHLIERVLQERRKVAGKRFKMQAKKP